MYPNKTTEPYFDTHTLINQAVPKIHLQRSNTIHYSIQTDVLIFKIR